MTGITLSISTKLVDASSMFLLVASQKTQCLK
jgi:hypothetical protein